jgi:uncharacterized membrane protein YhaH (DUF805 family)
MTLEDKLFSFEGRLRRRDYWLLGISLGLLQVLLAQGLIFSMVGPQATFIGGPGALQAAQAPLPWAITAIVSVVFLWPGMALMVKRCHDRNHSATLFVFVQLLWLMLNFLPVKSLIANQATVLLVTLLFGAISLGIGLWFLVDLGILDGTPGDNEFGPSPKGADRSATMIAAFE